MGSRQVGRDLEFRAIDIDQQRGFRADRFFDFMVIRRPGQPQFLDLALPLPHHEPKPMAMNDGAMGRGATL